MSDTVDIPAHTQSVLVLTLDTDGAQADVFLSKPHGNGGGWPLKSSLGATHLDPAHIESFPLRDLAGVGLRGYLSEGLGLDEAALTAEADRIDGATGRVVILHPAAFGDTAQRLTIAPPLGLIGLFPATRAATTMERLRTPSAEGTLNQVTPGPVPTPKRLRLMAALAAALVVVGILIAATGGMR